MCEICRVWSWLYDQPRHVKCFSRGKAVPALWLIFSTWTGSDWITNERSPLGRFLQGGPLLAKNEDITPLSRVITQVTKKRSFIGVINSYITIVGAHLVESQHSHTQWEWSEWCIYVYLHRSKSTCKTPKGWFTKLRGHEKPGGIYGIYIHLGSLRGKCFKVTWIDSPTEGQARPFAKVTYGSNWGHFEEPGGCVSKSCTPPRKPWNFSCSRNLTVFLGVWGSGHYFWNTTICWDASPTTKAASAFSLLHGYPSKYHTPPGLWYF